MEVGDKQMGCSTRPGAPGYEKGKNHVWIKAFQSEHLRQWFVAIWDEDNWWEHRTKPSRVWKSSQAIWYKHLTAHEKRLYKVLGEEFQNNEKTSTLKVLKDLKVN